MIWRFNSSNFYIEILDQKNRNNKKKMREPLCVTRTSRRERVDIFTLCFSGFSHWPSRYIHTLHYCCCKVFTVEYLMNLTSCNATMCCCTRRERLIGPHARLDSNCGTVDQRRTLEAHPSREAWLRLLAVDAFITTRDDSPTRFPRLHLP